MTHVAVIGAGMAGTTAALSLADANIRVDLYDSGPEPLLGASAVNEGKIHLGYVYAMDASFRTAQRMLQGAAKFQDTLSRWTGRDVFDQHISRPFLYAVPKTTMLDYRSIKQHFHRVAQAVRDMPNPPLRADAQSPRELSAEEMAQTFDPKKCIGAFETDELAIDPLAIRDRLLPAVLSHPNIACRLSTEVTDIVAHGSGCRVHSNHDGAPTTDRFDQVINASWHQRLKLDATFGIRSERATIHRYKCGLRLRNRQVATTLPPVTFLVGEYGDTVSYGDASYVSWYPTGLLSQESDLSPKFDPRQISTDQKAHVTQTMLAGLRDLMPAIGPTLEDHAAEWSVVGGFISAWGETGISDAASELHARHDIGVHSHGCYHSVDTGKYTLGPGIGAEAAARIIG